MITIVIGAIAGVLIGFLAGWITRHDCDAGIYLARERAAYLRGRRDQLSEATAIVRPLAPRKASTVHTYKPLPHDGKQSFEC